ncbi:hypothetical protein N9276_00090 [Rhodopirellula sp.]|jgi:hypothetical protein|nr:hypothetical protein [Rhodopirellula sp.]
MNLNQPPSGVGIELVESSDEQLVVNIPPGGARCRFLGLFGLAWLAIVVPVSIVFLLVPDNLWEGGKPPPKIFLLLLFSIPYAVGFGILYGWLRMRFTKILISVTADQFALQRTWFKRQKFETVSLDQNSLAKLVESHRQNGSLVYAIRIRSADELESEPEFATRLSYEEKSWLAGAINHFLRNSYGNELSGQSFQCTNCSAELPRGHGNITCEQCNETHVIKNALTEPSTNWETGSQNTAEDPEGRNIVIQDRPPSISPNKLPRDSSIRIDLNNNETLAFSYRFKITHPISYIITAFLSVFCAFWFGITLTATCGILFFADPGMLLFALIPLLLLVVGLVPLSILIFLVRGRVKIKMNREKISGSIGALLIHKTITISNHSITEVGIGNPAANIQATTPLIPNNITSCVVKSSERDVPLTWSSDSALNHQVAGLVMNHLEHIGIDLPTE